MEQVIEAKRKGIIAYKYKTAPSSRNCDILRTARHGAQQPARYCASNYWLNLCSSVQIVIDTVNAKDMYSGIKEATGPLPTKNAPLKCKISSRTRKDSCTNQ